MKVLRLQSENIKRLTAVDITPTGNLVVVGGKNAAGKSSVLDSIAMALGGKDMCPAEPIRAGESEGKITVTLDDIVVTRRFSRDRPPCDCGSAQRNDAPENKHSAECAAVSKWSETRSTLTVKNKDGASYPSPQAMLDKLMGRLTFDPLAFSRMDPKPQDETLRRLVGLDVTPIERQRKTAFDERAMLKKSHAVKDAQLQAMPFHANAPAAEIQMEAISQEMLTAEQYRKAAEDAERAVEKANEQVQAF